MKKFKNILFILVLILVVFFFIFFPVIGVFQIFGVTYTNWQSLAYFVLLYIFANWLVESIIKQLMPDLSKNLLHFFGYLISLLITDIIISSVYFPLISILAISILFTGLEYLVDKYTD